MSITRRSEYLVSVDRDVSLDPVAFASPSGRLCPPRTIFPKQISRRSVQRLNDAVRVRQVHNPVVDNWRSFLSAWVIHRPRPRELKSLDVPRVDLIKRAVPPRVVGSPPVEPIARSGVAQHGLGDWAEVLHLRREPRTPYEYGDQDRNREFQPHNLLLKSNSAPWYPWKFHFGPSESGSIHPFAFHRALRAHSCSRG